MRSKPTRRPGTYPATNKDAIETPPAASAYTMRILLGGITRLVVADATFTAAPKLAS